MRYIIKKSGRSAQSLPSIDKKPHGPVYYSSTNYYNQYNSNYQPPQSTSNDEQLITEPEVEANDREFKTK